MIRDILLIFWRFHRIGFPSRYEAHAILAMLAVSVWHFCLVLAAAAACSGSCEDGETSLVQVGSWPVESLKYPKNEKRVRRSMKVMGFSFFSEFGNEMKMTRCEIQGANRHDLIFWCNSCHCPKQADQHSILSEKIWNDADHCAIYVCVCIYLYIFKGHTHTDTHSCPSPIGKAVAIKRSYQSCFHMYLNKKTTNLLLMKRELHGSIGDQSPKGTSS